MTRGLRYLAAVGAVLLGVLVASCSASQSKADLELAAITGGCKVALDLEKDAGATEALVSTTEGCRAAVHTWMAVGEAGAAP
jgi:hypothetical protein